MKIIIKESKIEKLAIGWLNNNFGDLEPFHSNEYPEYIFYIKNGEVIFDYNKKNGLVYISYDHIWSFFIPFFGLHDEQIRDLTKQWVEEYYKLEVSTTGTSRGSHNRRWRDIFRRYRDTVAHV